MRNYFPIICLGVFLCLAFFASADASSPGNQGALTLLEAPSARSSALGEAFSSASDDIAGLAYNPSLLSTLSSGELSFLYQRGSIDDSYAHLTFGLPSQTWSWGASLGYYNSGTFNASEDGINQRTITAEKDMAATAGFSRTIGPGSVGVSGKIISTTLIETDKATAMAVDVGYQMKVSPVVRLGAAAQNFGTPLRYGSYSSSLARTVRVGSELSVLPKSFAALLFVDVPYYIETKSVAPGIGLEKAIGPLALRAGYRSGSDLEGFTVGAGFQAKAVALDYSFGLVKDLDSRQRISVSYRFGISAPSTTNVVAAAAPVTPKPTRTIQELPAPKEWEATGSTTLTAIGGATPAHRVYVVKPGDTWAIIAHREYGTDAMIAALQTANRYLVNNGDEPSPGMKILLPKAAE